ncbi:MAG: adenosine deaminase family protein, partial [Bacteriovoracia bacterium]
YGAESIFQAITETHADRLGHGYSLFDTNKILDPSIKDKQAYVDDLSSFIADKRIMIEICLTSNLQTNPELEDIKNHSFGKMLEKRIATSLCTDNRLVSNTTVSNEIKLALENFEITPRILKDIIAYGFTKGFYPGTYVEKRNYAKQVMNYYDSIAKKYNIEVDER